VLYGVEIVLCCGSGKMIYDREFAFGLIKELKSHRYQLHDHTLLVSIRLSVH
jgi:hypothetical protein